MVGTNYGWWKILSPRRRHEVTKVDMENMEEQQAHAPAAEFTLQQAEAHYNAVMMKARVEEHAAM